MRKVTLNKLQIILSLKLLLLFTYMAITTEVRSGEIPVPQKLTVAAIDWCPQICSSKDRPGYVIEIIKAVFSGEKYQLQIDYFPWSRAIRNVTLGQYDALLSPAKKEAPHLVFPLKAVGSQRMCFFVKESSNWKYEGPKSLKGVSIGIAADTSIEELNGYIVKHPEQFQFQPYHERFVKQNALKLLKGRMDTFIFTLNTTQYTLKNENLDGKVKNAGCTSKAPIYMAFTPNLSKKTFINGGVEYFDKRMSKLAKEGTIEKILKKYKIE